jgi:acetyl-CoA carboxylase biotin carboxylase subunit
VFRKVLVANRGEIAVRVIRALRELEILSVAVYSDADRASLHVRMADEAAHIGPSPSTESYLRIDRILDAAHRHGTEAIHPGYGFLSENAGFAEACEQAAIAFVGPPPSAIRLMGSKTEARKLAAGAGVPVVPGTDTPVCDAAAAARVAGDLRYPVLLKAAAGGGGKGMRRVDAGSEIDAAFRDASSEAERAFGDGSLYVEKLIDRPRHIEIQVLGDRHGHMIHLGERECSIQRRHQKLVEECPSPLVAARPEIRFRMGEAALKVACAAGYYNAGTVEFLVDSARNFYFLEMNTRLQVEHPVTEMTTNFDLVKEQIRVAAGDPLTLTLHGNRLRGHSIECRVNAEDPGRNFQPSPGLITAYHPPGGPGVRVDTHIYAGYTVPPYYDSLLAKVIVHGNDRAEALARMRQALDSFIIEGVTTTIPFLGRVMRHPDFVAGQVDTKFLEREPHLLTEPE